MIKLLQETRFFLTGSCRYVRFIMVVGQLHLRPLTVLGPPRPPPGLAGSCGLGGSEKGTSP